MADVQEWVWKYYKEDKTESVKCKRCGEVVSTCPNDTIQNLKDHLYYKHEITELDEHPERYQVLQNYEISKLTATCKKCKNLFNLASNNVDVVISHLKFQHPDKYNVTNINNETVRKMFDETPENHMKCKGCKSILRKTAPSRLIKHLLKKCRHFTIKNPRIRKVKDARANIRDNYEKTDDEMTRRCKSCNETLTISKYIFTQNLKSHLRSCRHVKLTPSEVNQMGTSQVLNKFDETDNNTGRRCKGCNKMIKCFKNTYENLYEHADSCRPAKTSESSTTDDNIRKDESQAPNLILKNTQTKIPHQNKEETTKIDE